MKKLLKRLYYRFRSNYTTEHLKEMGLSVGNNFKRMHDVIIDPSHCWLIAIGNNVTIAPRVHILAHDASLCHHLGFARIGNVTIGDNVFIGAESVILPNVTIGNNTIIGANSTVSKNIPSNVVAVGNPAKVICSINEYIEKNERLMQSRPCYNDSYTLRNNISIAKKKEMRKALINGFGFVK